MATLIFSRSVPSDFDDDVDNANADLPPEHVRAYPCKVPSCLNYGKSWLLRSNFFLLKEQDLNKETATTPAACHTIEKRWRYTIDPNLPPWRPQIFIPERAQTRTCGSTDDDPVRLGSIRLLSRLLGVVSYYC